MADRTVGAKMAEKSWKEKRLKMAEELKNRGLHPEALLHERVRKTSWFNGAGRGNYTPRHGRPH